MITMGMDHDDNKNVLPRLLCLCSHSQLCHCSVDSCDVSSQHFNVVWLIERSCCILEFRFEELFSDLSSHLYKFLWSILEKVTHLQLFGSHYWYDTYKTGYLISHFTTSLVWIGSLQLACLNTSSAVALSTQLISIMTFPGRILVLQVSTSHLPLPIGISSHFFVYGRSGKTLNRIFHTFLVTLTITFLADSSCLLVRYPPVTALSPYSQNATRLPVFAFPLSLHLNCFLNFHLFGESSAMTIVVQCSKQFCVVLVRTLLYQLLFACLL